MLSLVIPCYNEADNLQNLINKILPLYNKVPNIEVIFVDNGSTDKTSELFQELLSGTPIRTVHVPINQGYGYGILAGLDEAIGNILSWTHADLQTDPEDILRAYDLYKKSQSDVVLVKGRRKNRRLLEACFTYGMQCYANFKLGTHLSDINAQPKLFSSAFFQNIRKNAPYDFSLDLYVLYYAYRRGKIKTIDVDFFKRTHGESKGGGGSWSTRIKIIKRTLEYINNFASTVK